MKEKIQKLRASEDFKQLVGYILIGLLGLVVDFGVFLILTHFFNFNVEWANFISSSCGLLNNFIWNSFANFKVHDKLLLRFISYYLVGQVTTLFTTLCLFIFVTKLGYDKFIVKVIATFVATLIQFVINKVITFRKDQSDSVA
ncbi:GtrA family protein [Lactobacillus sp. PV034]|uniref:GtrA family protein n=1 Tax=Lactobacillus sp. PV034 TaxID=2594495 RepID=UPI00223F3BEB|nr:GtrA family protein [Lactobacillus sp. PV034]QNQ80992.1 GtrA family protein [Lactobacillus sp. PV034]